MPQLAAQQPPPPDYYAENLRRVLDHVRRHYGDVLHAEEQTFAEQVLGCSESAQRLFARLIGRKGPWLRIDKLSYREVDDLLSALEELQARGLVALNPAAPADALLGLLTNVERMELFPRIRGATKPRWIQNCVGRYGDQQIVRHIARHYPWVIVRRYRIFALYQLLFFGDPRQDLTTFVLQDLGVMRFESYDLNAAHRQFADRAHLQRYLHLRSLNALSQRLAELPALAQSVAHALWLETPTRLEQRVKDQALNRLGQWHERRGEYDAALDCYARSVSHPARERTARLLRRLGDEQGVRTILCEIRTRPRSSEEEDFAERFGCRRRRSVLPVTEHQLDGAVSGSIEAFAIDMLTARGGRAWHLENHFSRGIAGLAFWPVVFADVPGAFVNPFQTGPVDLHWPDFLASREQIFHARLDALREPRALQQAVRATWERKRGVANRLVSWAHFDRELVDALLESIPADALLSLAQLVLRNLHRLRTGFPDLVVIYGPGEYEFVEVKGPTDQIQPAQRVWLKALAQLQLPARVVKFKA